MLDTEGQRIWDWQRRFRAAPRVWFVVVGGEQTDNWYESKEAAEVEANWWRTTQRKTHVSVGHRNVHSMQLAKERWKKP